MKKHLFLVGALVCLFGLIATPATKADPLQLSCVTPCSAGTTTLVSSGGSVTFDFTGTGTTNTGQGFIGIFVPDSGAQPTLSTGTLQGTSPFPVLTNGVSVDTLLGESDLDSGFNFSNLASASEQADVTPTSFTVYEFDLGTGISVGHNQPGVSNITADNLAQGSVIVGWLETSTKTLQTPLSESITAVPEPGTAALFGLGLLLFVGAGFAMRRTSVTPS
jgi:hypothetical protein